LADHWVKKSLAHIIIKKTTCLLKFSTHFETPRALAQLTQRTLMVQHQAGAATPRRSAQQNESLSLGEPPKPLRCAHAHAAPRRRSNALIYEQPHVIYQRFLKKIHLKTKTGCHVRLN
jgi:hypothetical protein